MKKKLKSLLIIAMILSLLPISYSGVSAKTEADDDSVLVSYLTSPDDLLNLIDTDIPYSSQDVITQAWSGKGYPYKIVIKEEGWLFIKYFDDDFETDCNLYSNFELTSKIASGHLSSSGDGLVSCYVKPGEYYYQIARWNGYETCTATAYVGFMPSSARIKVDKITYSSDKSMATVTFDYDTDYLPDFNTGTLRVEKGYISYTMITDKATWKVDNRANALSTNSFTATANGKYGVQIAGTDGYFCMASFEIKGLKNTAPSSPKITVSTKNSKKISGTGLAEAKIYVVVDGKTYTGTVGKNGKWTITTNTTLKKGTVIKAYVTNAAGTKSNTTSVTVK